MAKRAHITIRFDVDLDAIPGWGHTPQDWITLATANVLRQTHYNTSAEVLRIEETWPVSEQVSDQRRD